MVSKRSLPALPPYEIGRSIDFMMSQVKEKIQITVDDRERPSGVVAELEKLSGVVVKVERLTAGDYRIDGAVVRKVAIAESIHRNTTVS